MGDGSSAGGRRGEWVEVVRPRETKDSEAVEKGGSHVRNYGFNVESKRFDFQKGERGRITIREYSKRGKFTMVIEDRIRDWVATSVGDAIVGRKDGSFKRQFRDGKVVILMETFSKLKAAFLRITQVVTNKFTSIIIPKDRSQAWLRFKMCLKVTLIVQQGMNASGVNGGGNGALRCAAGPKVGLAVLLTRLKGDAEWEKIGEELSKRCGRAVEPILVFEEKGFVGCADQKEVRIFLSTWEERVHSNDSADATMVEIREVDSMRSRSVTVEHSSSGGGDARVVEVGGDQLELKKTKSRSLASVFEFQRIGAIGSIEMR